MRVSIAAIASVLAVACGIAYAQPPTLSKLEVVGNYAGRVMKLTVDGKVEYEGRGHLDPPGVTWRINVLPGAEPAPVELEIEPCEQPVRASMPRDGATYALIIQGCDIRLVK